MKKILLLLLLLFTFLSIYSLDSILPDLTEAQLLKFREKGYLKESKVKYKDGFRLIPKDFSVKDKFISEVNSFDPELCVELLFEFDKPKLEGDDFTMFLQENMLAVSDQVGIEYFSDSRKKMHPLIKKSYMVESIKKKRNKMEDPVIDTIQSENNYTLFQEDTTFNGNFYSLKSRVKDGVVWNQMDNLTKLSVFYLFKAIDTGALRVDYIIIPHGDKIIIYSVVQIQNPPKVTEILGRHVNIPDSVRKRIQAVIEWYIKRINYK